jgi:hypothetical protein
MRSLLPVVPFVLALAGCGLTSSSLDAESALLVSATSGAEEAMSRSSYGDTSGTSDPDRPPLFRECNAEGDFVALFNEYDKNADGELAGTEATRVQQRHPGGPEAEHRMRLLGLVYDLDGDGALSDSEKATLFDDFTVRCEALHAKLLTDFDADGDGVLSDSEKATAEAALEADRAAAHDETDGECPNMGGDTDGGPRGPRHDGPPPDDAGAPPADGSVPPPLAEFDTDGDGLWSDAELTAFRTAIREKIRNGDPLLPPPPAE